MDVVKICEMMDMEGGMMRGPLKVSARPGGPTCI